MTEPYPLLFRPLLYPKVWGGRRLERFGKPIPARQAIGESWEIADLASTAASGAGGAPARSVIENGPLAGRTLHDAIDEWGPSLLGPAGLTRDGNFPLLVKYLDAAEHLSVQVHPSPAYAAANPDAHLKTECWYVLDAEPGSVIYKGVREGVSRGEFARRVAEGTVPQCLVAHAAVRGEMHELPSGTCHALGAGVLVAEVQTPSDTTFRLYDWVKEYNRPPRAMHVAQALECTDFGPAPAATRARDGESISTLVANPHFTVREVRAEWKTALGSGGEPACLVVMAVGGRGVLRFPASATPDLPLSPGVTAVIPAACAATLEFDPAPGERLACLLVHPSVGHRDAP